MIDQPVSLHLYRGTGFRLLRLQKGFRYGAIGYLLLLSSVMVFRSWQRPSVVAFNNNASVDESPEGAMASDSKLELHDFYRVQTKEGRNEWEIRAEKARYLAKEDVTFITRAEVLVNRKGGDPVTITSDSAKLTLQGEELERAELEGHVVIRSGESMTMRTEFAIYSNSERTMTTPKDVEIDGGSWRVTGGMMEMFLDEDITVLNENVRSRFDKGESIPEALGELRTTSDKKRVKD